MPKFANGLTMEEIIRFGLLHQLSQGQEPYPISLNLISPLYLNNHKSILMDKYNQDKVSKVSKVSKDSKDSKVSKDSKDKHQPNSPRFLPNGRIQTPILCIV
jgi:hypothetical protein